MKRYGMKFLRQHQQNLIPIEEPKKTETQVTQVKITSYLLPMTFIKI
jgi:hypothetical protein